MNDNEETVITGLGVTELIDPNSSSIHFRHCNY